LKHNADMPTSKVVEGVSLQHVKILPGDHRAPLCRSKEAGQDVEERRFSASGVAEHEVVFTLLGPKAGKVENDRLVVPMLNTFEEDHDALSWF